MAITACIPSATEHRENKVEETVTIWEQWSKLNKANKWKIKDNNIQHFERIISNARQAQEKGDITSIWKMIRSISGRRRRQDMPMTNAAAKLCVTEQMEEDELIRFLTTRFGATDNLGENEPHDQTSLPKDKDAVRINTSTTIPMMRKLNIHKAIPHWSIPTAIWLLAKSETKTILTDIWNDIGETRTLPTQWDEMQTIWLGKTNKDTTKLDNRRAINLTDPAMKGYLNDLQTEIRETKAGKWAPATYGGVPLRNSVMAITVTQEIMSRAKKARRSYFMYLGAAEKAFDKIKRSRIWKSVDKQLSKINPIAARLRERHRRTLYATKAKHKCFKVRMTEGIAQGDPNAQSLFVMTYEDFGQEIDENRSPLLKMDFDVPTYLSKELQATPSDTISLHRHM